MSNFERKWSMIGAGFAVLLLVLPIGCTGFFVNQPTSVTVTPNAPSLTAGQTQTFTAQAAFSDNTTKNVTPNATWSTSNPCIVAIIATGNGAGNATTVGSGGSVTVTASYNGVSGTATPTAPTGLTISPCQPQKAVTSAAGIFPQVVFQTGQSGIVFSAAASGTDVSATWTSNNTSVVTFQNPASGAATFVGAGSATITATSNTDTGSLALVVQ
jgi:uncharacterized protein YjdB